MASNPIYYAKGTDDNFFRKRYITTIFFALGLLLFFLPFAELRCGSVALLNNTGVGLAIGSEWKVGMGGNELIERFNSELKNSKKTDTEEMLSSGMNIFLLVAIAAAIFGMFVVLSHQKWKNIAAMCAGILACIMMIVVVVQLKMLLRSALNDPGDQMSPADALDDERNNYGDLLKMSPTIWFYMSLVSFICAAFFSFKKYKLEMQDDMSKFTEFDFQRKDQPS